MRVRIERNATTGRAERLELTADDYQDEKNIEMIWKGLAKKDWQIMVREPNEAGSLHWIIATGYRKDGDE